MPNKFIEKTVKEWIASKEPLILEHVLRTIKELRGIPLSVIVGNQEFRELIDLWNLEKDFAGQTDEVKLFLHSIICGKE